MFKSNKKVLAALVTSMMLGSAAFANGYGVYSNTADRLGVGGSGSADNTKVSNAWYNPASLGGITVPTLQISASVVKIGANAVYDKFGGARDTTNMKSGRFEVFPSLYYAMPIEESDFAFGFAANTPYGMSTHWQESERLGNSITPVTTSPIDTEILAAYFTPSLAWTPKDILDGNLSLAAGPSLVYAQSTMKQGIWGGNTYLGRMSNYGDGYGYAWMLGASYNIKDIDTKVAAKYQSHSLVDLCGNASNTVAGTDYLSSMELDLPQSITVGVTNNSIEDWTFNADVVWTDWRSMNKVVIKDRSSKPTATMEEGWTTAMTYRLGAEYQLDESWTLRGGYVFDQTPISTLNRNASLPQTDAHEICLGAGYKFNESSTVDLGYAYVMYMNGEDQNGTQYTHSTIHMLSLSYSYKFN